MDPQTGRGAGGEAQSGSGGPHPRWRSKDTGDLEAEKSALAAAMALIGEVAELREYLAHFLEARVDQTRYRARTLAIRAVLGAIGALLLATFLVTSLVLFLTGLAAAAGDLLFGNRQLGALVAGAFFLLVFAALLALGLRSLRKASLKKAVEKYEQRQSRQRTRFGRSVAERSAQRG
jgi:hypothetical protein